MHEKDLMRRELAKQTALLFVVFAVLFALLGLGIYSMVSANVFRTADDQLLSTAQDADVMALDTVPDDVDGNADEEGEQALSETAYSLQQSIVESNPQFITLVRNEQGDLVDTVGLYASYPAFLEDVPFDPNDVDRVYQTETGGHAYRGITFLLDADGAHLPAGARRRGCRTGHPRRVHAHARAVPGRGRRRGGGCQLPAVAPDPQAHRPELEGADGVRAERLARAAHARWPSSRPPASCCSTIPKAASSTGSRT